MAELAEIDKQSAVVAMEAKINKLAEMVEAKTQRLSMVHEDENLSELIDKKRVKMMEREIKEIEKAKLKLEKLYEKMTGGKKKEVVDEEMDDNINPGNTEEDQAKKDAYDYDARPAHMKEGEDSTYEEDDTIDEAGNIDSDQEPKSFLKKTPYSSMEEVSRWQKLAGVISEEEYRNRLNEALNKPLDKFGQDLEKRLNALGFETKVFGGQETVPSSAVDQIQKNPKLAGMSYIKLKPGERSIPSTSDRDYEYIEVVVNAQKLNQLKKVKSYFQTAEGDYGPDKNLGWIIKNVKKTNPGDIIGSDIQKYGDRAILSYHTSLPGGEKVKTRDA
jgi:hypothetical protein